MCVYKGVPPFCETTMCAFWGDGGGGGGGGVQKEVLPKMLYGAAASTSKEQSHCNMHKKIRAYVTC